MFADPISPPAPSVHPLTRLLGQIGIGTTGRREYDESVITRFLDARIGESGHSIPLPELEGMVESQENPLMRLALQMHRARRFYERPESKGTYHEIPPTPPPKPPKLPKPKPDFTSAARSSATTRPCNAGSGSSSTSSRTTPPG